MDAISSLYKEELELYKEQVNSLRSRGRESDAKNQALISQLKNLEEELEQTKKANNDLRIVYQHVHDENVRLTNVPAITQSEPQLPALTDSNSFTSKNDAGEMLSWVSDRDKLNQRVKFLERECVRYQRDNTTLGKQVLHLLRLLEEERGMIIPRRPEQSEAGPVVSAADVIDKHLITFDSIEQMQKQNQQLISIVKDLSAEQELADAKIESDEVKRLTAQVEELSNELESIKSDRERVLLALKTMHRERDLFKILLCKTSEAQSMTPQIFQRMVSVACSSGPAIEDTVTKFAEKDEHIKDLRDLNTRLQQESDSYKKDISDLRQQADEEIKLKEGLLKQAHAKILDESKRADILSDRNEILERNIEALTREHDELRVKCNKIEFEMGSATEETAAKLREKDEHIKDLREINTRLQQEIDSYKKDISDLRQQANEEIKLKEELLKQAHARTLDESKRADVLNHRKEILEKNIEALTRELDELRVKCSEIASEVSTATREAADLEKLQHQFLQMQELRNQEREMRLDLEQRLRPKSKKERRQMSVAHPSGEAIKYTVLRQKAYDSRTEDIVSKPEAVDSRPQAIDSGPRANDLVPATGESIQKDNDSTQPPNDFMQEDNDSMQQDDDFIPHANDLMQQDDNSIQQANDVMRQDDDSIQQANDVMQQDDNFIQQANDSIQADEEIRMDESTVPQSQSAIIDESGPADIPKEPEPQAAPARTITLKRRNLS